MKTIIKSCAFALATGALTSSCYDFVNILPKDLVTEDNFWDEKADVDQMVTGIYYKMQYDAMMRRYIVWGELRSDNIYTGEETSSRDRNAYEFLRENILSTNAYTTWTDFYNIINSCNQIIVRAPEVGTKDPTYTQSNVNATIAEATALRSLMYFYLIRTFRDVPFYRNVVQSDGEVVNLPVSRFEDILPELIADCEAVLPSAIKIYAEDMYNTGRITQNAIHALLADMYLWQGNYDKCIEHSDAVIASFCEKYQNNLYSMSSISSGARVAMLYHDNDEGVTYANGKTYRGYPLYTDKSASSSTGTFGSAFNTIFGPNGGSEETIFELIFTPEDGDAYLANEACGFFFGENKAEKSNSGKGALGPNAQLYSGNNTTYLYGEFDARRYCNMETESEDALDARIRKYASSSNRIDPTKAKMYDRNQGNYRCSALQNYNWIFYRLADVMLMKAEALVEKITDTSLNIEAGSQSDELRKQALYIVYAINSRSCMSDKERLDIDKEIYKSQAGVRTLVATERRKELMFEGKRWFDLVRVAMRNGTSSDVLSTVRSKFTKGTGSSVLPNMESLFLPYNKQELKVNTSISQKPYWASLENAETAESTR